MAPLGGQAGPGPQQHAGEHGRQAGRHDERVSERAVTQEDGGGTLGLGPGGLRPQSGHVTRPEEPCFHGEAG